MVHAVYGRARRIIVSSPPLGANARALAPYRDRIEVIPFGIDASAWDRAQHDDEDVVRREMGGGFVLFAGRHVPYKGVDVLLRALTQTRVRLVIAGDGPARAGWERLAAELGVADRVVFTGEVEQRRLIALLRACDVFVLPSVTRAEAFGYVQLEAMVCRRPMISTDVPSGVSWVNRDGETGVVVRAGDPAQLAEALDRLMKDPALRARMGEAGRQRAEAEFSMTQLTSKLMMVYGDVAAGSRIAC